MAAAVVDFFADFLVDFFGDSKSSSEGSEEDEDLEAAFLVAFFAAFFAGFEAGISVCNSDWVEDEGVANFFAAIIGGLRSQESTKCAEAMINEILLIASANIESIIWYGRWVFIEFFKR